MYVNLGKSQTKHRVEAERHLIGQQEDYSLSRLPMSKDVLLDEVVGDPGQSDATDGHEDPHAELFDEPDRVGSDRAEEDEGDTGETTDDYLSSGHR